MKKKRKGQAALEFLMTYGWAFLVIMIMVGALAYFGILDPTRFLPDRCQFGTPLLCQDDRYTIRDSDDGTVIAGLVNNYGSRIEVYGAEVRTDYGQIDASACDICFSDDGSSCTGGTDIDGDHTAAFSWEQGDSELLTIDCPTGNTLSPGDKVRFTVRMQWYPSSSTETFAKTAEGEIYATVQDT